MLVLVHNSLIMGQPAKLLTEPYVYLSGWVFVINGDRTPICQDFRTMGSRLHWPACTN
jgi:hypothetical protein